MAESMLVFAPNANSYRRLRPLTYAPTAPTWGWNNRTVALRIPPGGPAARRIEHRVAGSDANPYLVLAAVLAGVLRGPGAAAGAERADRRQRLCPGAGQPAADLGGGDRRVPRRRAAATTGSAQRFCRLFAACRQARARPLPRRGSRRPSTSGT